MRLWVLVFFIVSCLGTANTPDPTEAHEVGRDFLKGLVCVDEASTIPATFKILNEEDVRRLLAARCILATIDLKMDPKKFLVRLESLVFPNLEFLEGMNLQGSSKVKTFSMPRVIEIGSFLLGTPSYPFFALENVELPLLTRVDDLTIGPSPIKNLDLPKLQKVKGELRFDGTGLDSILYINASLLDSCAHIVAAYGAKLEVKCNGCSVDSTLSESE